MAYRHQERWERICLIVSGVNIGILSVAMWDLQPKRNAWIEHHKQHLFYFLPDKLKCFLCGEAVFTVDIHGGHDEDRTFELRMLHIAGHMTQEYSPPTDHVPDPLMLDHMLALTIITKGQDPNLRSQRITQPEDLLRSNSSADNRTESTESCGVDERLKDYKHQESLCKDWRYEAGLDTTLPSLRGIGWTRFASVRQMNTRNWPDFDDFIKLDSQTEKGDAGKWTITDLDRISWDVFASSITSASGAVNEFMFSFNTWLDWTLTCGSGAPAGTIVCGHSENERVGERDGDAHPACSAALTNAPRKRGAGDDGDDGKKRRYKAPPTEAWVKERRLACPYLKHNPYQFGANGSPCRTASWPLQSRSPNPKFQELK